MILPPEDWLRQLNLEFRVRNVEVRARPFEALTRYCQDFGAHAVALGSPEANAIFEWFVANTKHDAHQVGAMFTGAYYYDSCFWPTEVPIAYGSLKLDAGNSLRTMPISLKNELLTTHNDAWHYTLFWANCVDYAYGEDDIQRKTSEARTFGKSLLANADLELRAATAQLLEQRPNPKAAMSCRMAVEIFMKAFLVLKDDLSATAVKALGHHLDKLAAAIRETSPESGILLVESHLEAFPQIHDRYTGGEVPATQLWRAYAVAVHVGSAVARTFSERDLRARVLASGAP